MFVPETLLKDQAVRYTPGQYLRRKGIVVTSAVGPTLSCVECMAEWIAPTGDEGRVLVWRCPLGCTEHRLELLAQITELDRFMPMTRFMIPEDKQGVLRDAVLRQSTGYQQDQQETLARVATILSGGGR